jgi:hypothetical protein
VARMLHIASGSVRGLWWRALLGDRIRPCAPASVGRWCHVYAEGEPVTICGLPLELLHWKPLRHLSLDQVEPADRCELCELATQLNG